MRTASLASALAAAAAAASASASAAASRAASAAAAAAAASAARRNSAAEDGGCTLTVARAAVMVPMSHSAPWHSWESEEASK